MSYLKGKDIKTQGDCLVNCFMQRIEIITTSSHNKPGEFEKW